MIDLDSLNHQRLANGNTVPAIGRLRQINEGFIIVEVKGFYDDERYLIRLSPKAINAIRDAGVMCLSDTFPADVNVGDRIQFDLGYSNGLYTAANVVAAPIEPMSIASVIDEYEHVNVVFVCLGNSSILLECYQEGGDGGTWFIPSPSDRYVSLIEEQGVEFYTGEAEGIAVNRRYLGVMWDVAGVIQITDIYAFETLPVSSDGSDEILSAVESEWVRSATRMKHLASLAGISVEAFSSLRSAIALEGIRREVILSVKKKT